jgi:hypothetical protein
MSLTFPVWLAQQHPQFSHAGAHAGAQAVLALAEGGATVPFIARYRKEQTGNLDEVAIRQVLDTKERWDELVKRQAFIVEEIGRQGKLTPELEARIRGTFDPVALEDLYLPYKQKRKTKAESAREAGLGPLGEWLWSCGHGADAGGETPEARAAAFVDADKGVADAAAALAGASDIIVERLSEDAGLRQQVRSAYFERGCARTRKGDKAKTPSRFENYFAYQEPVKELLKPTSSHRYLAMRRGWMEEELVLTLGGRLGDDGTSDPLMDELLAAFEAAACPAAFASGEDELRSSEPIAGASEPVRGFRSRSTFSGAPLLKRAARLALRAHVMLSIDTEVHKALREVADAAADASVPRFRPAPRVALGSSLGATPASRFSRHVRGLRPRVPGSAARLQLGQRAGTGGRQAGALVARAPGSAAAPTLGADRGAGVGHGREPLAAGVRPGPDRGVARRAAPG